MVHLTYFIINLNKLEIQVQYMKKILFARFDYNIIKRNLEYKKVISEVQKCQDRYSGIFLSREI